MTMPPGSNDHGLSRREFLRSAAGLAALGGLSDLGVSQEPGAIPKRKLGPIDYEVTIAALGVGAMGDGRLPEPHVLEVFQAVLERGVNYIDTASTYGDTQRMIGPLVEEWRDRIFLVSKCKEHTYNAAWAQVEQSLRDLRTDHLDLLHLHNLGDFDLDHLEEPDGTLTAMRAMKDQGIVRHLGASGHLRPPHFLRLLERVQDVEVIMVPINVVDRHTYAFDSEVVPAAKEAGLAVVAMKVLGGVTAWRYAPAQGLLIAPEYMRPPCATASDTPPSQPASSGSRRWRSSIKALPSRATSDRYPRRSWPPSNPPVANSLASGATTSGPPSDAAIQ